MPARPPTAWPQGKPPPIVHEYVEWLVSLDRVPATKTAWRAEHGIGKSTTEDWDRDDRVKWLIREKSDQLNMGPERVQRVMNALFRKAESGDTQAAKLYMEHVDKITPLSERSKPQVQDLSDEELEELARGLIG